MINRRKSPRRENSRATVKWPATVVSKDTTIVGRVENLSRGGALLYLKEQVEPQESIRIAIEIPEYNDVISTEGEVVRIYPREKETEHYPYAAGIKFTHISPRDLRFFTGNLAPEWQQNYREPEQAAGNANSVMKNIGYGLLGAAVVALLVVVFRDGDGQKIDARQIAALEHRLKNIELQLEVLPEVTVSNRNLIEQLHEMRGKLSELQEDFVSVSAVEELQTLVDAGQQQLQEQVIDNKQQIAKLATDVPEEPAVLPQTEETELLAASYPPPETVQESAAAAGETSSGDPAYHLVKKGETLYRIGLKYGLTVDELRQLNNLSAGDVINPDQRLLVQ